FLFLFFFSSRRRHTRSDRDWSSDVCSSDLGLLMYIHGGYWRSLDKKRFSFVAPALADAGITVAVPDYAVCPAVRVADIVMQMVQIGRASCRERVEISVVAGGLKKKNERNRR